MIILKPIMLIVPVLSLMGQVQPQVVGRPVRDGQVTTVFLAPRYTTAIRLPEPVNSVVVGDPASFSAEYSEREPQLVFVKPITTKPTQTSLLVSTIRGLQVSLLLVSRGEPKEEQRANVDFLVRYKPAAPFIVQPSDIPSAIVPRTTSLADASTLAAPASPRQSEQSALDHLLDRQCRAPMPVLYGQKPGISPPGKELVKTGVSEVIDQGSDVVVLFSVVNAEDHAVELMPPQIQLRGRTKAGWLIRRSRWSTAEQLPVTDFRLSRRRLGPGERADGVVVFRRPSFKQSTETLFLQMAESGAVDRPALVPIGFGISSFREVTHDGR
ncbi:MAG: hypothetical protein ACM336_09120 [Acidobacteriota bacterium]